MGLFATVGHFRSVSSERLREALDAVMRLRGYQVRLATPIPDGPTAVPGFQALRSAHPTYLLSTDDDPWLTVVEASLAVDGAPWFPELSSAISAHLKTYALCLMVHDDDVFFYNLDRSGEALDGYNSCPQYFEKERLPEKEIEDQRHTPEAFRPLLPNEEALRRLRDLLQLGWWSAHDKGLLDADGVPIDDAFPFTSEVERMAQVAGILGIPREGSVYPYAEWMIAPTEVWASFGLVAYEEKRRKWWLR